MDLKSFISSVDSWLCDLKPHLAWGHELSTNELGFHLVIEGYDSLMVFEHWVDLKFLFSLSESYLEFLVSFLDPKHNG